MNEPNGEMAKWPSGRTNWLIGHLTTWPLGYLATWLLGYLATWLLLLFLPVHRQHALSDEEAAEDIDGRQHEGEGTHAAVVTHAATVQAAQIAEVWEHDLQRVLWDAVLDALSCRCRALLRRRRTNP